MNRYLQKIIMIVAVFTVMAIALPETSYAEDGATIEASNCNPAADHANDYRQPNPELQSCVGRGIKVSGTGDQAFKIKVKQVANAAFIAKYLAACLPIAGGVSVVLGPAALAVAGLCVADAANMTYNGFVPIGTKVSFGNSTILNKKLLKFEARIEGDKGCVYGQGIFPLVMNYEADRSDTYNRNYLVPLLNETSLSAAQLKERESAINALPSHCVHLPEPAIAEPISVPGFIAQSCVDYDSSATQFRWPKKQGENVVPGESRAFLGVVVECIEESMLNLFFGHQRVNGTLQAQTVFSKTQENFRPFVITLLVLYVIMLGYKYGFQERGIKQKDAIGIILKFGVVMFFALGPGVTMLLPGVIGSIKEMSTIILDAGSGDTTSEKRVKYDALKAASAEYATARNNFSTARLIYMNAKNNPNYSDSQKAAFKQDMDTKEQIMRQKGEVFEKARLDTVSFGYNYCDFRPFVNANKYYLTLNEDAYEPAYADVITEDGVRKKRVDYMQFWDTLDCKISKYLGIGSNPNAPKAPQVLVFGVVSITSFIIQPIALVAGILALIFVIFMVLVVARIVHIYIMAFIALVVLVYISPLTIPMMLFEYTKNTFDVWFKNIIAYSVQPILLFAFLALMFAIFDTVMFGNNFEFHPIDSEGNRDNARLVSTPSLNNDTIFRMRDAAGNWRCPDENTLGCKFETFVADKFRVIPIEGAEVIAFYYGADNGPARSERLYDESNTTTSPPEKKRLTFAQYTVYIVEFLKLVLMTFLLHALLGQVETMATTLTNAAGGGAAALSAAPRPDPGKMVAGALGAVGTAATGTGKFVARNTAGRALKNSQRKELLEKDKKQQAAARGGAGAMQKRGGAGGNQGGGNV